MRSSRPASALNDHSARRPASRPRKRRASLLGRNDSLATGSYREANLQRQLSGDEPEASSVATRPNGAGQQSEDLSFNV